MFHQRTEMFSSPCKHAADSLAKYQDRSIQEEINLLNGSIVILQPYDLVLNEGNSQRKVTIRILYLHAAFRYKRRRLYACVESKSILNQVSLQFL